MSGFVKAIGHDAFLKMLDKAPRDQLWDSYLTQSAANVPELPAESSYLNEYMMIRRENCLEEAYFTVYSMFMDQARIIAVEIINQIHSPLKRIQPIKGSTLEYIHDGIRFRIIDDIKISEYSWLYGKSDKNTLGANKSVGNELRAMSSIFKLDNYRGLLNLPYYCLIDYMGYRVSAQTHIHTDAETLVFGTVDGGANFKQDFIGATISREYGYKLNLKEHYVESFNGYSNNGIYTNMPGNFQLHKLEENGEISYWGVELSQLFPATSATNLFHEQFRPEFLQTYQQCLSSDSFSYWGRSGYREHNSEVFEAINVLHSFTKNFVLGLNIESVGDVKTILHQNGINLRLLGIMYNQEDADPLVRNRLLLEMVARSLKVILTKNIRTAKEKWMEVSHDPYKRLILKTLNNALKPNTKQSEILLNTILEKYELPPDTKLDDKVHELNPIDIINILNDLSWFQIDNWTPGTIRPSSITVEPKVKTIRVETC
eukprot:TRINITY_DN1702_c0_g1_i2.p1 TRINITY_DN1702_c0_g1~~TRINITY_DN1702_c0_g1_i2.p1  ORF type:complete len:542 (-),score=87.99 TRINITY_DN1702_c0_g1_i2:14-1471(-)